MGHEYDAYLAFGYKFTRQDIWDCFGRQCPEVSHEELRFDPRTGLPTAPAKVIDEEDSCRLFLNGVDYGDDVEEFIDELGSLIGASVVVYGAEYGYVIGPGVPDEISVEGLMRLETEASEIGFRLRELGLDAKEPMVQACLFIS